MKKDELDYWAQKMEFDRETRELEEGSQRIFSYLLAAIMVVVVIFIIAMTR